MSISHLIETYGYLAVFLLVGAESLGIPLPGGSGGYRIRHLSDRSGAK
jgi:membrane protein DedA with SNARE-associated domain